MPIDSKNKAKRKYNQQVKAVSSSDFTPDTDIWKQGIPSEIDADTLESNDNPMSLFNDEHNQYQLKRAMNKVLADKENYILVKAFGLFGEEQQDLEEIAQDLGCTRERVRRMREQAIMKLAEVKNMINIGESRQYNNTMNKNKQIIRLTESTLHKIIAETVNRILEGSNFQAKQYQRYGDDACQVKTSDRHKNAQWEKFKNNKKKKEN